VAYLIPHALRPPHLRPVRNGAAILALFSRTYLSYEAYVPDRRDA
jgi:hypothetical protein